MSDSDIVLVAGSVDLNDGVHTRLVSWRLGAPSREAEQLGGPGIDIARSGPLDESAWVESVFVVAVSGSDVDDVAARVAAINAELRDCSPWTVGLKNSAYTGALRVKLGRCVEIPLEYPWDSRLMNAAKTQVEVTVLREPWVYGATDTLYSASAVTLPCILDLSAMVGDAAAPLDMTFTPTVDLHQLVAGVYPEAGAPLTLFVRRAVQLTWSGGAAASDAAGYPDGVGNTVWKTNASAGVYADIDVSTFRPGSYAVYANVARDAACSPATVETAYTVPVAIEGTDLRRQLLGVVSLPTAGFLSGGASTLRVTLKGDGTDYVYLNTVEFMPLSWGAVGWHHGTASGHAHELRLSDHLVYADAVASMQYAQYGRELLAKGGTLVYTGEGTAEAPAAPATASVSYLPRWEQLPSAGGPGAGPGI